MTIEMKLNKMLDDGFTADTIRDKLEAIEEARAQTAYVDKACIQVKKLCADLATAQGVSILDAETTINMLRSILWSKVTMHFRGWADVLAAADEALALNGAKANCEARSQA